MNNPRIAFFGTPELCIPILKELKTAGIVPVVIVTNSDKPVGRKQIMTPSPVKIWGQENNIPVLEPKKLDTDFQNEFALYGIDLSLVVAYGKIIPEILIKTPTFGTINVHYSLLPKYRGASPVESSILSGDTETGVCIQDMAYDLDSGDIYVQEIIPIDINETAPELRNRLNGIAKKMLVELIPKIVSGQAVKTPQQGESTYCKKTKKEDGQISFDTITDAQLWNMYRGYYGWPGIFYFDENSKRIKITKARFEHEKFIIEKIIPEGKKEQDYINK
jgi:methionyl-tRNA formyltransferase